MPNLTINGKTYELEHGKRLVLAIEESGTAVGHRCGGNARCTTCRVKFLEGEPDTMTAAEYERLKARELYGTARLSCQIIVDRNMNIIPLETSESNPAWSGDTGPTPETNVVPLEIFIPIEQLDEINK